MRKHILIVTALWGRPSLTKIVLEYYRSIKDKGTLDIQLLCVGSEGERTKRLANDSGWNYVEAPNTPVSQKFNRLFEHSVVYDFDLLVLVGSDDLLSESILACYAQQIPADYPNLVGLKDLYFYNVQYERTIHFPGYPLPSPKTIGAGRCFSRRILEIMNFRPWQNEILPRGLDSASSAQMRKRGIGEEAHTMEYLGGVLVDIKDPMVNLTSWELIANPAFECPVDILNQTFPQQMAKIRGLKKEFVFLPWEEYTVKITSTTHPLYGQEVRVKGDKAIELAIKQVIDYP